MLKNNVLFLCTGNSARSQMAEAILRKLAGDRFDAHSAGLEPKGINPYTIRVMEEAGYDLRDQRSKSVKEYMGKEYFRYVVFVCAHAEENCPAIFAGAINRLSWPFDDPASATGSDEEILDKFREVRDQIEQKIKTWISEIN